MPIQDKVNQVNTLVQSALGVITPLVGASMYDLCLDFKQSNEDERAGVTALDREACNLLLFFAWDCAAQAIRNSSSDWVVTGLTALIIEGGRVDIRDSITGLARLLHSALRLHMNADDAFSRVALLSPPVLAGHTTYFPNLPPLPEVMRTFPSSPGAADLSRYSLCTVGEGPTFSYKTCVPSPEPKWWQFWR